MMRTRRSLLPIIAISAMGHGALVYGLSQMDPDKSAPGAGDVIEISFEASPPRRTPERPAARPPEEVRVPEQPTASVAALPIAPEAPRLPSGLTKEPSSTRRPAPTGPTSSRSLASDPSPVPTAPDPATEKPSLLAMRTGRPERRPDLRVPRGFSLSPRAAASALAQAESPIPTDRRSPLDLPDAPAIPGARERPEQGMMIPDGNGTFRFDHPGFTAKVARDGRVTLKDKPSAQGFVEGPCLECLKKDFTGYVQDPSSGQMVNLMALLPKVGVRFDLTDYVMRKSGAGDPYSYEKDKFMTATRDQREKMWHAESAERLKEALQILPSQLADVWNNREWTPAERRRVLFDLWDECAETGSPERIRLGRQIRVTILAFIRKRLPAGGEHAYTEDELRALNESRSSKQPFAPYR